MIAYMVSARVAVKSGEVPMGRITELH